MVDGINQRKNNGRDRSWMNAGINQKCILMSSSPLGLQSRSRPAGAATAAVCAAAPRTAHTFAYAPACEPSSSATPAWASSGARASMSRRVAMGPRRRLLRGTLLQFRGKTGRISCGRWGRPTKVSSCAPPATCSAAGHAFWRYPSSSASRRAYPSIHLHIEAGGAQVESQDRGGNAENASALRS